MFLSELTVCLVSLTVPQAPPQNPATVMQELPLRGMVAPTVDVLLPRRSVVAYEDGSEPETWSGPGAITASQVAGVLQIEGQGALDDERMSLETNDSRRSISLRGDKDAVQSLALVAGWLERTLARPVQVDVRIYEIDAVPDGAKGVYPADGLAKLGGLRLAWSGSSVVPVHRAASFDAFQSQPVVLDFDVEVAQKADIADPKVSSIITGLQAVVVPFAVLSSDGELGAVVDLNFGVRRDASEQWSSGVMKQPLIDSPRVDSLAVGMSGRVPNGGSLVAWAGGDPARGPSMAIEVSVRWKGPAPAARNDAALFPVAFALPNLELRASRSPDEVSFEEQKFQPGNPSLRPGLSGSRSSRAISQPDELEYMIQEALGAYDPERVELSRVGPWLYLRGGAEVIATARAALTSVIDDAMVNLDLSCRTTYESDGAALHVGLVPGLSGMPVHLRRGQEGSYVRDFDVEIAQSATAMNPVVEGWFSGMNARGVLGRAISGFDADIVVDLSARAAAQRRAIEGDRGGSIDTAPTDGRRFSVRGVIDRGATLSLGQGPALDRGGRADRTAQAVTIR